MGPVMSAVLYVLAIEVLAVFGALIAWGRGWWPSVR